MDNLKQSVVRFLDTLRRDALSAGLSPLTQYDQIQTRARWGTRTASTIQEWADLVRRGLRVVSFSAQTSNALLVLCQDFDTWASESGITRTRATSRVLSMIESEIGWFIALLRVAAQDRRDAYNERERGA